MQENSSGEHNEKSFSDMLEESLKFQKDEIRGSIVKGKILRIDKDVVFIDLGLKSEGIVPINEFGTGEDEKIEIGTEVEVFIERSNSEAPRISKSKADLFRERKFLNDSFKEKTAITATPASKVKGGYLCNITERSQIRAFLPNSQVNLHPDSEDIIGKPLQVRIIQNDDNGMVISRRVLLEEERELKRQETLASLAEGQIVSGEIINIIDKGAFVELGGVTGFIPISEVSWGRIKHPSEIISEKQELQLKVMKIEDEGQRVTLSLKQASEDPWQTIEERYQKDTKEKGRVVSVKDFGVFVELEPGIEGLIHVNELSWVKSFRHPKEVVKVGATVEVVVLEINREEKRLSLSLKRVEKSPWEIFRGNQKTGSVLTGTIKNINEHGVFVELEENLVGLVRPENITWEGRVNPLDVYGTDQVGQQIDVSLLHVDVRNQKIALGIKQLSVDLWEVARGKYKKNETTLTGKVKEIRPQGLVVELENEIEGFYRNSDLETIESAGKKYSVGDEVTGLVTGFEKSKRQINLSVKELEKKQERESMSQFIASHEESQSRLGDILGEKLKSLDNN